MIVFFCFRAYACTMPCGGNVRLVRVILLLLIALALVVGIILSRRP